MATRHALAELARDYESQFGRSIELVSIGGVDAVRRVRSGESFDFVVLRISGSSLRSSANLCALCVRCLKAFLTAEARRESQRVAGIFRYAEKQASMLLPTESLSEAKGEAVRS